MEKQHPIETRVAEFSPGTPVIYGMHGKCNLIGTEYKDYLGEKICFYKLEIKKTASTSIKRQESAIWVPVDSAKIRGLRFPMSAAQAQEALEILMSREYYFKLTTPWSLLQSEFENSARSEGGIGLAKIASFLYVLKRKMIVPTPEVSKLQDKIKRHLFRELSDALEEKIQDLENRVVKGLKSKLLPDQ